MRIPVDQGALAMLICEELQVLALSRRRFTAYDITRSLRHKQPHANILHTEVRSLVHHYMDELVCSDEYEAVLHNFGYKTAILYQPAPRRTQRGIPGVPLLPLN